MFCYGDVIVFLALISTYIATNITIYNDVLKAQLIHTRMKLSMLYPTFLHVVPYPPEIPPTRTPDRVLAIRLSLAFNIL